MELEKCPTCGSELDPDQAHGLCPACLLEDTLQPGLSEPVIEPWAGDDPIKRALEEKLRSQYRIVRLLGRGGMGRVYLARDLTLEREVAIKVLNTASSSRVQYDRFRREARTAAKLSHPNIVPLHAFGEVEGMPYFVMGYIRGESLAARLRREGKVDEDEARRILGEVAHALDHAHRLGVIHRDIKPDNVLLDDETGRALLTDFGVAKAVGLGETLTQSGGVIGTPQFMSPEQASGQGAIDARSDLYSLGVMGYAMLGGRLPFEGKTAADVLTKHLTQLPPPLRSLVPAVSDSTVQAVERCLAKDPAARWQDARSLAQTLGATEVNQLPDSLIAVEGRGLVALVIGVMGLDAFYHATMLVARAFRDEGHVQFLRAWTLESGLLNAMFIIGAWSSYYAFVIMRLRGEGFSVRQSQGVIWREPSWWLFWYPRALRRSGNIWNRLPATVRHFRAWNIALVLLIIVMLVIVFHIWGESVSYEEANEGITPTMVARAWMAVIAAMLVLWLVLRSLAMREVRRKGLDPLDSLRVLLTVAPSRVSFWARPHIAAILAPVERAEQPSSDSPHDYLRSILRDGSELSGRMRPLGAQAAVAARHLIAAIEQCDREIADLVRNIEPNEEARLVDKIEALAGDGAAPLRTLLEQQLELIRDLSARVEEANQRRNRRVEMIKILSLHIASLRARVTETPSEIRHLSENVRALCEEIRRQGAAHEIGSDEMPTVTERR